MSGALVVISGLPAAGKSTLARRIGADLRVPVVQRDRLRREALLPIGEAHPEVRPLIAPALDRLMVTIAEEILDAGGTAVLDGNFNKPEHAAALHRFVDDRARRGRAPRCAEVCLWGEPAVLRARFVARAEPPLTDDLRPYFEAVLAREHTTVLSPPAPIFCFDTTDWSVIDDAYPSLLAELRGALAGAPSR